MKSIFVIFLLVLMTGCSAIPTNTGISFGKKCSVGPDEEVAYSWIWLYDRKVGLKANAQACAAIDS